MIRTALLLALCLSAFAADMVHQRVVLKGGEELVGWWCADQGVLYLDNGKRRLIDKPAEQVASVEAVPAKGKAPARKQFKAPADLPYGRLVLADGPTYLGWWDEEANTIWTDGDLGAISISSGRTFEPGGTPKGKLPEEARAQLRRRAVERD